MSRWSHRPAAEWREVTSLLVRQGLAVEDWPALTLEFADELSGLLSLLDETVAARIAARAAATAIPDEGTAQWTEGAHALLGRFEWLALQRPALRKPYATCSRIPHPSKDGKNAYVG